MPKKRKNLKQETPGAVEPNNSSRDETHPEDDELYISSAELSEESMSDPFGEELFPQDGRGSTDGPPIRPRKQVIESTEELDGLSEYSLNQSASRK